MNNESTARCSDAALKSDIRQKLVERLVSPTERENLTSTVIPVYHHYSGQLRTQPAYIVIDPERLERDAFPVYADYSGETGNAVTAYYWHGREAHIDIQANSVGRSILDFIESHADEIEEIISGYECQWDGSNLAGCWSERASELLDKLQQDAEDEIKTIMVYELSDLDLTDVDADTDPKEYAQTIWDDAMEAARICGSEPEPGDWYPDFTFDELVEHITTRVTEAREEEEEDE